MMNRRHFSTVALVLGAAIMHAGFATAAAHPSSTPETFQTGGSFPGWSKNAAFGSYLLSLRSAAKLKICWLSAASGDCEATFEQLRENFAAPFTGLN